jgi:ABC-2 type transport system permease protein
MIRSLYIALNEVKLYLQDKGDLAFSLILPIVTFALVYGAFGGQTLFEATAYVVDEDNGHYSSLFIEQLEDVDGMTVETIPAETADTRLERSDVLLVIYIPEDFSEALDSGEKTELVFRQRGNAGQEGQIIASIARGIAGDISREFQAHQQTAEILQGTGISGERIDTVVEEYLSEERETPFVTVETVDPSATGQNAEGEDNFVNQFLPGIVTMYVLFAVTLTARAIVEERRKGTLERLLTTRLSASQLFFGKFLSGISRGFVQTLILLGLSYAVFQLFTPLSFLASLIIALVFTAAASAIGLIIASIARSEDGATWIAVVFSVLTFMLGGTFFTVDEGSGLYFISRFSINTYANDAFKAVINEGHSLVDVGPELGVLVIVIVVGIVISRLLFRAVPGGK